jgi:putative tricarboxylic transport membrane protein
MTDTEPNAEGDRSVAGAPRVDLVVSLLILAIALLLGWDSRRIGNAWAPDGPQAGYFPFYLSVLMGAASLVGIASAFIRRPILGSIADVPFLTRVQFGRVFQVFMPSLGFVVLTQFLGLYVASFILVAGFMWWIGRISVWISLLTSLLFSSAMFLTFEIAFDVIMPRGPLEAAFGF